MTIWSRRDTDGFSRRRAGSTRKEVFDFVMRNRKVDAEDRAQVCDRPDAERAQDGSDEAGLVEERSSIEMTTGNVKWMKTAGAPFLNSGTSR